MPWALLAGGEQKRLVPPRCRDTAGRAGWPRDRVLRKRPGWFYLLSLCGTPMPAQSILFPFSTWDFFPDLSPAANASAPTSPTPSG